MVVASVRTIGGETDTFSITIELHQGSVLSPYLFALVIDNILRTLRSHGVRICGRYCN